MRAALKKGAKTGLNGRQGFHRGRGMRARPCHTASKRRQPPLYIASKRLHTTVLIDRTRVQLRSKATTLSQRIRVLVSDTIPHRTRQLTSWVNSAIEDMGRDFVNRQGDTSTSLLVP